MSTSKEFSANVLPNRKSWNRSKINYVRVKNMDYLGASTSSKKALAFPANTLRRVKPCEVNSRFLLCS